MSETMTGMRAEMALAPVFDARGELQTLVGILGAVLYLSGHDDEEPWKEDVITALAQIQEKLADLANGLDGAIVGMKIVKEKEAVS